VAAVGGKTLAADQARGLLRDPSERARDLLEQPGLPPRLGDGRGPAEEPAGPADPPVDEPAKRLRQRLGAELRGEQLRELAVGALEATQRAARVGWLVAEDRRPTASS
jgi:hypothetical protein